MGFEFFKGGQGSHEVYKKWIEGHMLRVDLDCHGGEIKADDIKSMAESQAKVARKEFWEAVKKKGEPKSHQKLRKKYQNERGQG